PNDLPAPCPSTPTSVEMTVTESSGYSYALRSSPRPGSSTPGGLLGGVAAYIGGGGLLLSGNSVLTVPSGVVQVEGGSTVCNGSNSGVVAADGFYSGAGTGPSQCSPTVANSIADPLLGLATPTQPAAATAASMPTLCGTPATPT